MSGRLFQTILLLGSSLAAAARTALVVPATGEFLYGHVRLTTDGILVLNADLDLRRELPLTNLAWVVFDAPASNPSQSPAGDLTVPWLENDVGSVFLGGGSSVQATALTIRSSGMGLQGASDSFHYVHQSASGDVEIVARVSDVHLTAPDALAGLMMRERLTASARHFTVAVTPAGAGCVAWRDEENGPARILRLAGKRAPCWLKIRRAGTEFLGYYSRNGTQWTLCGKATLPFAGGFHVGLATTSGRETALNRTTFDRINVGSNLVNEAFLPRAELVSGSVIMGRPVYAGAESVSLRGEMGAAVRLPLRSISRLLFQWVSPEWLARIPHEQSGVWLANGEFLEGDCRAIDFGCIRLSSVLYGARTLDANSDVLMVSFHSTLPRPVQFVVTTVNGSRWRAESLALGDNEIILQEPALGRVTIPIQDLTAILRR